MILDFKLFKPYLKDWGDILKPWVESKQAFELYQKLKSEQEKILPSWKNTFNFLDVSPEDLKVLIIGMDPYSGLYKNKTHQATGWAFDCRNSPNNDSQPSLVKFQEGIANEFSKEYINQPNLSYLTNQGIMLGNRALTVKNRKIGSHIKLWDSFWAVILENLPKDIPIILLGDEAKRLERYIWKIKHPVYYLTHPSYAARIHQDWDTKNVFSLINKQLESPIKWTPN